MPSPAPLRPERPGLLAAPAHTALLAALFLGVALAGALLGPGPSAGPGRVAGAYLPLLGVEAGLVLYVWLAGLRPRGLPLRALWGQARPGTLAGDAALALAGWALILALERLAPSGGATALLPRSSAERAAWVAVALGAALAEELVFRGYLLRQLAALSGRPAVGLLGQAALFGVAHLEQGGAVALRLALYGLGLGALAWRRGNLRAAVLCHALVDLSAGLG